jgi:spoIIIJ-associated protein
MNSVEKTAKTVDEAVQAALDELGVTKEQVNVEVLEEGKSSILGFFSRNAKVRVTVKEAAAPAEEAPAEVSEPAAPQAEAAENKAEAAEAPSGAEADQEADKAAEEADRQETAAKAKAFLEEISKAMGMNLIIEKFVNHKDGDILLKLHGDGLGVLIGKHGQTLDALQYLTNLAANKGHKEWNRVILDAENYRQRRRETLEKLARHLAQRVKRSGRKAMLEPMNPYERKIVHMSLQDDPEVTTYSEGEEPYRKVVIDLK